VGRLKGHGSWLVKKDVVAKPPATCAGQEYKKKRGTGKNFAFQAKKCPPGADAPPGVWKAKKGKRQIFCLGCQTSPWSVEGKEGKKAKHFALGVRPPPGGSTRKARKGKRQSGEGSLRDPLFSLLLSLSLLFYS
jgi:hypothetical protein